MADTFAILIDRQPFDGEFFTRDELFRRLPSVPSGARIVSFDLDEVLQGMGPMREVTEDMVWDAHNAGAFHGHEKAIHGLMGDYISVPVSALEHRLNRANNARKEVA